MSSSSSHHPAAWFPMLSSLTTVEVKEICAGGRGVALLPLGSVEPHGPHLPLSIDTTISEVAAFRAARQLADKDYDVYIAPAISYGVTDYAHGFAGAVTVPAAALTAMLRGIVTSLTGDGWAHVCLVNNHLEPAHDAAVRAAIEGLPKEKASVACPLTKRWARTLSEEFKRGDCHGGRYETSLALAVGALVRDEYRRLPPKHVSLSDEIKAGKKGFAEMGLDRAYTGDPAAATKEEGEDLLERLAAMIVGEVTDALDGATEKKDG